MRNQIHIVPEDVVFGHGIWLARNSRVFDQHAVGVTNSTDFLRSHSEGELLAEGRPVHIGRSAQIWIVEIRRGSDGVLVARHATGRRELALGGRLDPVFGPVVMIGDGGLYLEALVVLFPTTCFSQHLAVAYQPLYGCDRGGIKCEAGLDRFVYSSEQHYRDPKSTLWLVG